MTFLVHVRGSRPNKVDVTRSYRTLPAARAQATRWTRRADGTPIGDWSADVWRVEYDTARLVLIERTGAA